MTKRPDPRKELGARGELLAEKELKRRGFKILERNYNCRVGEIDLVARERDTTVFVEVKTRTSREFGSGLDAITPRKRHKLVRVAQFYLSANGLLDTPARIDVVAVDLSGRKPAVELVRGAFDSETWG